MTLPIRGEKRIIPSPVNAAQATTVFEQQYAASGQVPPDKRGKGYAPTGRQSLIDQQDFYLSAARKTLTDYMYIRLAHRGVGANGSLSDSPAVYRFLINPNQVSISRSMIDGQAMTRGGWQFGVWGEDSIQIRLTGKTAGQYWSFGITDRYQQYTESYRNLTMLQMVFENNGYFFEGEQMGEGPLAASFTRRRIKMHSDVELTVGNFIWSGMFESMSISQSADQPWLASFSLSFVAWKERFRSTSGYNNLIPNDVVRGQAWQSAQSISAAKVGSGTLPSVMSSSQSSAILNLVASQPTNSVTVSSTGADSITAPSIGAQVISQVLGESNSSDSSGSFSPLQSNIGGKQ